MQRRSVKTMNKVIMSGRLTRDPEIRYGGNGNETCIANFGFAVERKFKREGQPEADFFDCTAFGKTAETIEKFCHKGIKLILDGEVQNNNYTDKEGNKVYRTRIMVNSFEFAESKNASAGNAAPAGAAPAPASAPAAPAQGQPVNDGFMSIPEGIDEELPFA